MKRLPVIAIIIFLLFALSPIVFATSQQAYQDYLFQFDLYRQKNTDFLVAKNEYAKFGTLTSQTTALEKTKAMLTQRDQLLHSYLTLLGEKLNEDKGLNTTSKDLYVKLIQNELAFLETHAQLIPSTGSLSDATQISEELESHYRVLQVSIRQILVGLGLGQLSILGNIYDSVVRDAQTIVTTNAGQFSPQKQETVNRWLLQITNKRSLYQQKIDAITSANALMQTTNEGELERQYNAITRSIAEARQYLLEGASFLQELKNALKYVD